MFSFKEIPFIKLLLPFILGIISGIYIIHFDWYLIFTVVLGWIAILGYIHKKWGGIYRKRLLIGSTIFAGFFVLGIMIVNYHIAQPEMNKKVFIVSGSWKATTKYFKAEALIDAKKTHFNPGKIMLYIRKDSLLKLPEIGDRILTSGEIRTVSGPKNPYQFNYARFLYQKGIIGSVYLKKNDFINTGQSHRLGTKRKFNRLKQKLTRIINEQPMSPETKALLQALLLGEKSNLDPEIKRAYTSAGAMHVLAVSGLHVGIVLLFINFFFKIFEFKKQGKTYRIIKATITLLIIWTFAGITGFSPSITRATTMFSFLVVGKVLNRNTNIFNSLAIAAFTLLFINPYTLLSVGFQLSFLAVFGIVFFHPRIYTLLYFKNILMRKTWELTSVSLSAQLTTFPIALLYFHQFPVYFLISNLVVIPFAFIIVISGLVLVLISPFEYLSAPLAYSLDHVVHLLNYLVLKVEQLPFYKIGGVSITPTETMLIYAFIGFGAIFFIYKNVRFLISSLLVLILLLSLGLYKKTQHIYQNELNFYSIYNHTAIDVVQYNKHVFVGDSLLLKQDSKISFNCENHWNVLGLSPIENTRKAVLNTPAVYPYLKLILTQNHLLYKNTLICINHSSHKIGEMHRFKNRILLINSPINFAEQKYADYQFILLNFRDYTGNKKKKITMDLKQHNRWVKDIMNHGFLSVDTEFSY